MMTFTLALSTLLNIASLVLFTSSIYTWLIVRRTTRSGVAHALGMSVTVLAILVIFVEIQTIYLYSNTNLTSCSLQAISAFLLFFVALVQFFLSKGYFNLNNSNGK